MCWWPCLTARASFAKLRKQRELLLLKAHQTLWERLVNQFDPTGAARKAYQEASRNDPFFVPPQINPHERKRLNDMFDKAVTDLREHPAFKKPDSWGIPGPDFEDPILHPKLRKLK